MLCWCRTRRDETMVLLRCVALRRASGTAERDEKRLAVARSGLERIEWWERTGRLVPLERWPCDLVQMRRSASGTMRRLSFSPVDGSLPATRGAVRRGALRCSCCRIRISKRFEASEALVFSYYSGCICILFINNSTVAPFLLEKYSCAIAGHRRRCIKFIN